MKVIYKVPSNISNNTINKIIDTLGSKYIKVKSLGCDPKGQWNLELTLPHITTPIDMLHIGVIIGTIQGQN